MEGSSQENTEGMRQVRLRLAACRTSHMGNDVRPSCRQMEHLFNQSCELLCLTPKATSHMLQAEQEVEEEDAEGEEEGEEGDDNFLTSEHECPLVQQKVSGYVPWGTNSSHPGPGLKSNLNEPQDQSGEGTDSSGRREKVEGVRQLAEARQRLEERELLILERLKLEEEERAVELQREKRRRKGKFIEALRAQMKERLSQEKLELPPLCCCGSSFWDSHPDTCANNCVFYNNPKAYVQALHSTMLSLDLR
ncbi:hypothetical protein INR49_030047 [Caranx melampygus]|nr:hypothetical protein INR49_030047 [Caranx melampygus]